MKHGVFSKFWRRWRILFETLRILQILEKMKNSPKFGENAEFSMKHGEFSEFWRRWRILHETWRILQILEKMRILHETWIWKFCKFWRRWRILHETWRILRLFQNSEISPCFMENSPFSPKFGEFSSFMYFLENSPCLLENSPSSPKFAEFSMFHGEFSIFSKIRRILHVSCMFLGEFCMLSKFCRIHIFLIFLKFRELIENSSFSWGILYISWRIHHLLKMLEHYSALYSIKSMDAFWLNQAVDVFGLIIYMNSLNR